MGRHAEPSRRPSHEGPVMVPASNLWPQAVIKGLKSMTLRTTGNQHKSILAANLRYYAALPFCLLVLLIFIEVSTAMAQDRNTDLASQGLESLLNMQVNSVSRHDEEL